MAHTSVVAVLFGTIGPRSLTTGALVVLAWIGGGISCGAQVRPEVTWMAGGHSAFIKDLARSADGSLFASASVDGTVKVWRTADYSLVHVIVHHTSGFAPATVAFSPDGTLLATGSSYISLWRTSDWSLLRSVHKGYVWDLEFTPDGNHLLVGTDSFLRLRVSDLGLDTEYSGHTDWVFSVAVSPDGLLYATGSRDKTAKLWSATDGSLLHTFTGSPDYVHSAKFSPDGARLATSGSLSGTFVRTWDVATYAQLGGVSYGNNLCMDLDFMPGSPFIVATALGAEGVLLWRGTYDTGIADYAGASWGSTYSLLCLLDGSTVLRGSLCIDRFDVATLSSKGRVTAFHGTVFESQFTPNGQILATASRDDYLNLWNASTGARISNQDVNITALAVSPDGVRVACADAFSYRILQRRATDGATMSGMGGHTQKVTGLAYAANGSLLVSVSDDRTIRVWNPLTASSLRTASLPSPPCSLAATPAGNLAAVGCQNGSVHVFQLDDLTVVRTWTGLENWPDSVVFSHDGAKLGYRVNSNITIYRTSDWALIHTVPMTTISFPTRFCFNNDASHILVGRYSHPDNLLVVRLSDTAVVRRYSVDPDSSVSSVDWSPSTGLMAIGRSDATLVVATAPIPTGLEVANLSGRQGETVSLVATLRRLAGQSAVPGAMIRFEADGAALGTASTDASGVAAFAYTIPVDAVPGCLAVRAVFDGDGDVLASYGEGEVTVPVPDTVMFVPDRSGVVGTPITLRAYLYRAHDMRPLPDQTVLFSIAGTEVGGAATDTNGRASLNWILDCPAGTYAITAAFAGDAAHNGCSDDATLAAQTWQTKMTGVNREGKITAYRILKAWLWKMDNSPVPGKSIAFKLDGTLIGTDNTRTTGLAQIGYTIADGAGAGTRPILAQWAGDGGYLASSCTNTLTVLKATPYIWVMPRSVPQGGVARLYAYFRRLADYQKQEGKTVSFKVDGTWVADVVTLSGPEAGIARHQYTTVEPPGAHTIRCEFAGDAWVDAGSGEGNLTIY